MSWKSSTPAANGNGQSAESVTILLAGLPARTRAWNLSLMGDARFRVIAEAADVADLAAKMAMSPDAALVEAELFNGPAELVQTLSRFNSAIYVILPSAATAQDVEQVKACRPVKAALSGDPNLAELAGRIYADVLAARQATPTWEKGLPSSSRGGGPTALKIVAVWNQAGGVGKTTIAANLAYESARRGLPTLLISLGAPDDAPLMLGLKPDPNIIHWRAKPNVEGLHAATQTVKEVDLKVLGGFPDFLSAHKAMQAGLDDPDSIARLIREAPYAGFAAIVVDTPNSDLAGAALSAANSLLLVSRPMLADCWRTIGAYRAVTEQLAGQHRIPPDGIRLVLNRVRSSGLTPADFHKAGESLAGRAFPPVSAIIPDDPRVEEAQNNRKMPITYADSFAKGLHALADNVLQVKAGQIKKDDGRVIPLGFMRLRLPGGGG
jgi:cellulose biosynthesis protein BcsQ